ncbi:hypothetical protein Mapa_017775 [Marchantia paleacea]|nr:hypothetical protein Mapa_017775 [Marchantia paleacea]
MYWSHIFFHRRQRSRSLARSSVINTTTSTPHNGVPLDCNAKLCHATAPASQSVGPSSPVQPVQPARQPLLTLLQECCSTHSHTNRYIYHSSSSNPPLFWLIASEASQNSRSFIRNSPKLARRKHNEVQWGKNRKNRMDELQELSALTLKSKPLKAPTKHTPKYAFSRYFRFCEMDGNLPCSSRG